MSGVDPNLRPARLSAGVAVLLALAALVVLVPSDVLAAIGVEAAGLALLVVGVTVARRGWRIAGSVPALAGVGIVGGAVALVWTTTADLFAVVQFAPGMLGVAVIAGGVIPVRGGGSRRLVKVGTALVFVTVLAVGVIRRPSLWVLLGCSLLAVLSWDAGENAVGLGAQVGRRARTHRAEGAHLLGASVVGAVAVGTGRIAVGLGSPGLSIGAFAVLVVGLILLAGALHG